MTVQHGVRLTVNGREYVGSVEARKTLVDFLREDLRLTGTHVGCEHGVCGACTIRLNGKTVRSCLLFAIQANGAHLETVEGLALEEHLHPLQQAFHEYHALQCGYCTPGMLMAMLELLEENPHPSEQEIRRGIAGNLCMCTGYVNIVRAVQAATARVNTPAP
jgi:aerobic-type carbon monoxide dehydrogenase small subunit (CoxS/CutS family)